jgi:uncharacterized protein YjbI with pentapeptide repeats
MPNDEHIALLKQGAAAWNEWRFQNADTPDLRQVSLIRAILSEANLTGALLSGAILRGAHLREANLSGADLREASFAEANLIGANLSKANLGKTNLSGANLFRANLSDANLSGANLSRAVLLGADLRGANLSTASLGGADLVQANLSGANLSGANLRWMKLNANLSGANLERADLIDADLRGANLSTANLSGANLDQANLSGANLSGANLSGANLQRAVLLETNLTGADLTGCRVYGVSAWGLNLGRAKQQNLVITRGLEWEWDDSQQKWVMRVKEPKITVDNIEVAQFVYLLLHNQKIRDVIDTITSKAVLILGRFTDERKAVLDALRDELRKRDYLPILFDFAGPATRDLTETMSLLARMARFIIADLTDPSSIPKELEAIIPHLAVPVKPLLEGVSRPYAMFRDYWKYEWVLPIYWYEGLQPLLAALPEEVIAPAEAKVKALAERRRMIEAELTKPQ